MAVTSVTRQAAVFSSSDTCERFEAVESGYHGMWVWAFPPVDTTVTTSRVQVERNNGDGSPGTVFVFDVLVDPGQVAPYVYVSVWLNKRDAVTTDKFAVVPFCVGDRPMHVGGLTGA